MKKVVYENYTETLQQDVAETEALKAMYNCGNPDLMEEAVIRLFEKAGGKEANKSLVTLYESGKSGAEEKAVAQLIEKIEDVTENKKLMAMYHSGNPDLKEEAIVKLFKKVEMFIWHFIKKQYATLYGDAYYNEELFSCCKIAFLENIADFDPEKGTLSTFMTLPFKHEMYEWVNKDLNDATGYHAKMMIMVQDAKKTLNAQGMEPTVAAISNLTGLSVKKVEQALMRIEANKRQSIDSDEGWDEAIKGQSKSPEELFLETERQEVIVDALKMLPEEDRIAIILYYGLDGASPRSYNAVAKKMHISAPQVQLSIARGLHILRGNTGLKVMFGAGSQNFRQAQLDSIEISLITNENFIHAYDALDEEAEAPKENAKETTVFLTF